ncbi:MAG: hypothetical protein K2H86_06205 [Muribaculaceae bacterium]|nr:hypothetical protein [Muribaculaceae bacterium]
MAWYTEIRYYVFRILLSVMLAFLLIGCAHTSGDVLSLMNRVDRLIEISPDSALMVIEKIDTTQISGRADRARYALLKSMALDKNYIDTTSFAVLQPALDYYLKHGNADQRLATRYYQGRIYMNRGDNDAALTAFLKASEDTAGCSNPRLLARLHEAIGVMYYKQFRYESFMKQNILAEKIYDAIGDSAGMLRCNLKILEGSINCDDSQEAENAVKVISEKPESCIGNNDISSLLIKYYQYIRPANELNEFLRTYLTISPDSLSFYIKMNLANAFDSIGDYSRAKEYVSSAFTELAAENCSQDDSIKYYSIATSVFEHNNMPEEALDAYKQFLDISTQQCNDIMNSELLFANKRHELELNSVRETSVHTQTILIAFVVMLISIITIVFIVYMAKQIQGRREITRLESEQLRIAYITAQWKIDGLNKEKAALNDILASTTSDLDNETRQIIYNRLETIEGFIKRCITGNTSYATALHALEQDVLNNRDALLKHLKDSYKIRHPRLIQYCIENGLDDTEIGYVCLLAMNLRNKEIGVYLNINRINAYASNIRSKLKIPKNSSTLLQHLKEYMS